MQKIGRNDPCWCGSGKKYKDCHLALDEKINSYKLKGWKIPPKKIIKRPDQIDGIRESGLVNIAVLDYVAENILLQDESHLRHMEQLQSFPELYA